MEDWQVKLMLEAQAAIVRVEGMKARNASDAYHNVDPRWNEAHFHHAAAEIERLAREMVKRKS